MPDLSAQLELPLVRRIEFHEELDSTNNRALALAANAATETPLLVLADRQSAGRGRGENRWWSAAGGLTFSLLLAADEPSVAADRWPLVSLIAALAVGETLRAVAPQAEVQLKWPNDVFLSGRKVCGILVEVPPVRPARLVVGIGVNVNNSFAAAPAELQRIATSLGEATGQAQPRGEILAAILHRFALDWDRLGDHDLNLAARWKPHCFLRGRTVQIVAGNRTTTGVCLHVDDDGALVLQTESGPSRCLAGVVARID